MAKGKIARKLFHGKRYLDEIASLFILILHRKKNYIGIIKHINYLKNVGYQPIRNVGINQPYDKCICSLVYISIS